MDYDTLYNEQCDLLASAFSERANVQITIGTGIKVCAFLSFIFSAFHGLIILNNKKMQQADSISLIMTLSFLEAAFFFNAGMSTEACRLDLP